MSSSASATDRSLHSFFADRSLHSSIAFFNRTPFSSCSAPYPRHSVPMTHQHHCKDASCASSPLYIVVISFAGFVLLNYTVARFCSTMTTFYNKMRKHKQSMWNNHVISYFHAWICTIVTHICFVLYPSTWDDLVGGPCNLCQTQVALSTGYFLADTLDFYMKGIFMDTAGIGIWIHHILVTCTFGASVLTGKYHPYLTATLMVELSNIFLHQRKLYLTSSPKPTAPVTRNPLLFTLNSIGLFFTMIFNRFAIHGYLLWRVWNERDTFAVAWHWGLAFFGMVAMNILNVQLFMQIGSSDGWFEGIGWMFGEPSRRQRKTIVKAE